jgi:hypothetical protein
MVVTVKIGNVFYDCTDSYSISQQMGAISTTNLDVVGSPAPVSMQPVQIYVDDVLFWGGIIQTVGTATFSSGKEVQKYRLTIQSWEVVLQNRLASEAYTETMYAHEIVQDLFDKYIAEEGITLGEISTTERTYDTYNFSLSQLSNIIQELCDDIGGSWYISPDREFYFLTPQAFTQIDAPPHITGLQLAEEKGLLRTVQNITGSTEDTGDQTEHATWIANQTTWTLGYPVSEMTGFTINGTTVGFGVLGVDDTDITKTFLYQIGSYIITLNSSATTKPTTGQIAVCVYKGYYDILCTEVNDSLQAEIAALNGTSGKIESVYTDETLENFADADAKAKSLLAQYNEREKKITCRIHDINDSSPLMMWDFDYPELGIVGQFAITERTINSFGVTDTWCSLTLKNKNFFARYGVTLVNKKKSVGKDIKVYKNSSISDSISISDECTVDNAGLLYYPTSGDYLDPMIEADNFYPGVSG